MWVHDRTQLVSFLPGRLKENSFGIGGSLECDPVFATAIRWTVFVRMLFVAFDARTSNMPPRLWAILRSHTHTWLTQTHTHTHTRNSCRVCVCVATTAGLIATCKLLLQANSKLDNVLHRKLEAFTSCVHSCFLLDGDAFRIMWVMSVCVRVNAARADVYVTGTVINHSPGVCVCGWLYDILLGRVVVVVVDVSRVKLLFVMSAGESRWWQ